jgi:hypothetical protein
MKYFGLIMAIVYVGAGVALLLRVGRLSIPTNTAIFLGIILIAYGAYRGYKTLKN